VERGAQLLRVHDVEETRDLVAVLDRIRHTNPGGA
jgi:dihydropteroate synthase